MDSYLHFQTTSAAIIGKRSSTATFSWTFTSSTCNFGCRDLQIQNKMEKNEPMKENFENIVE